MKFIWSGGYLQYGKFRHITVKTGLALSIQKWESIVKALAAGRVVKGEGGTSTCGLCFLYNNDDGPHSDLHCVGCPVSKATGHIYCKVTPFELFVDACGDYDVPTDPKRQLQYAKEELDFLKGLQPTVTGKVTK